MPKYISPKITSKKIKLSFFLSNVMWLDQFNLVGNVYAQSGGTGAASNSGGFGGCAGTCGCGSSFSGIVDGHATVSHNSSCNSACSSASGSSTVESSAPYGDVTFSRDYSCNSNSNCNGCSSGNDANGGSGGHS